MAKRRRRFQPRVEGGREQLPSCVLREIHRAVEQDAARFNVSRSWVIAVILANHYRVSSQVTYDS